MKIRLKTAVIFFWSFHFDICFVWEEKQNENDIITLHWTIFLLVILGRWPVFCHTFRKFDVICSWVGVAFFPDIHVAFELRFIVVIGVVGTWRDCGLVRVSAQQNVALKISNAYTDDEKHKSFDNMLTVLWYVLYL